jgi:drug/metabolite transporter (DMT)-like permease
MLRNKEILTQAEIILSMAVASGMIMLMYYPEIGKATALSAGGLISLLYIYQAFCLAGSQKNYNFQVILDIINLISAAIVILMLATGIIFFRNQLLPELIAGGILVICTILNLSNRHVYKVREDNYAIKQIRLLILFLLAVVLMTTV